MRGEEVIVVFDIGKTNKKILLFNKSLNVVYREERRFSQLTDPEGFDCENIGRIQEWVQERMAFLVYNEDFSIKGVNFSTYGASLVFLDKDGNRLTPLYSYLKNISPQIKEDLFEKYDGEVEFCRKTASPSLGMLLNSGVQILWLKEAHPDTFSRVESILHFPHYLSYLFTKRIVSEFTSIGCHTFLWDFDEDNYHRWIKDLNLKLPEPVASSTTFDVELLDKKIAIGTGIHDSSSSLVPYMLGSKEPYILLSTGTWCINMNPFNHTSLTRDQLRNDCLNYFNINKQQVKSSRFFLGHMHDMSLRMIAKWFDISLKNCLSIEPDEELLKIYLNDKKQSRIFFRNYNIDKFFDLTVDLSQFKNYSEAYHRLMYDLTKLNVVAISRVIEKKNIIKAIYVTGGFVNNKIFLRLLATFFNDMEVYTSEIENASAMGAALTIWHVINENNPPPINLNLKKWDPIQNI